jgi:uncharacterized protein YndB with AHSA1/START domain
MTDDTTHSAQRSIKASPGALYNAFVRPDALARWMPPKGAVGRVELLEPHEGGRLRMVLTFDEAVGKTSSNTDVVEARFVRLRPAEEIVLAVEFAADDPAFAGTMTMTWAFSPTAEGAQVTVIAENVPVGIRKADHEQAMRSTLANLAAFVEPPRTAGG